MITEVEIIRVDGTRENQVMKRGSVFTALRKVINAEGFDVVNLRDGRVMIVDDTGLVDGKPVNPEATKLYHGVCRPGVTHPICGDVAIAYDKDFA